MAHVIEPRTEAHTADSVESGWVRVQARRPNLTTLFGLPTWPASMPAAPRDPITASRRDGLTAVRGIGLAVGLSLAMWAAVAVSLYLLV